MAKSKNTPNSVEYVLTWLEERAKAHRQRWLEYTERSLLYKWGYGETDMRDERISEDLADQNLIACAALEKAIMDLREGTDPWGLEAIAPPLEGSLAYALEKEKGRSKRAAQRKAKTRSASSTNSNITDSPQVSTVLDAEDNSQVPRETEIDQT